jgi:hypothetical protein
MQPHLEALAANHPQFHLHLCFSGPQSPNGSLARPAQVQHHHSRIDVRLLRSVLPLKPHHFYVFGLADLLTSLVPALDGWGVPAERIHVEAFGPANIPRRHAATIPPGQTSIGPARVPLAVTFASSGKTCDWRPGRGQPAQSGRGPWRAGATAAATSTTFKARMALAAASANRATKTKVAMTEARPVSTPRHDRQHSPG